MFLNRQYAVLGNWKMHLTLQQATELAQAVKTAAAALQSKDVVVGVIPAALHLTAVAQILEQSGIELGGQYCHSQQEGAFTGDISATMLADAGCGFVLAGHSERRQWHHEDNDTVQAQATAALEAGLHAVICVGETEAQREQGRTMDVIEAQLRQSLPLGVSGNEVTIAYEPIWAIGTGKTAQNEDIMAVHSHIRAVLQSIGCDPLPRVLYGGSVKANNALDILSLPVVDGVLVGGASLDAQAFATILQAAQTTTEKR